MDAVLISGQEKIGRSIEIGAGKIGRSIDFWVGQKWTQY